MVTKYMCRESSGESCCCEGNLDLQRWVADKTDWLRGEGAEVRFSFDCEGDEHVELVLSAVTHTAAMWLLYNGAVLTMFRTAKSTNRFSAAPDEVVGLLDMVSFVLNVQLDPAELDAYRMPRDAGICPECAPVG